MKRVLMIAYHFPPLAGSSGIQRTLRFVQHLPALGWEPIVLTTHPRAYDRTSDDLLSEVAPNVKVERAFALDTARHLSIDGRYPAVLARPDRWVTWRLGAVPAGLRLIRQFAPAVIWSTYPIATAHMIGGILHRRSRLPWIADFRDPMAQDGYPADPLVWQSFKEIEERAIQHSRFSAFTTPGAARFYRERYPDAADRIVVIENGYDEESFRSVSSADAAQNPLNAGTVTLLHSGIVYPSERDPTQLFVALRRMVEAGLLRTALKLRFRAAAHDEMLAALAREHGVADMVELLPPVSYRQALDEMVRADGLLILQAANCNEQIPAKLYEYLRAARPIVALTDPHGDTAGVLRNAGIETIARLDSATEIGALLTRFLAHVPQCAVPDAGYVARASRQGRAEELARLLERATVP